MLHNTLIQLQDPTVDLTVTVLVSLAAWCALTMRRDPRAFQRALAASGKWLKAQRGSSQLAQQAVSAAITIVISAFCVALLGYGVLQMWWTGACGNNITQISGAEDLRFSRGYGYTANGNITAAAFVDSDGNNDYLTVTPRDPAGPKTANYTFAATQTNGDWSYTVKDPATAVHAAWTMINMQGGAATKTNLEEVGPGGVVQPV